MLRLQSSSVIRREHSRAPTRQARRVEIANGGTLFLDEVGNLSYEVQVQLLRALQERRIRPVGGTKEIDIDIRLVCATNENLEEAVSEGRFREDLYHRINEFTIYMPKLSERGATFSSSPTSSSVTPTRS